MQWSPTERVAVLTLVGEHDLASAPEIRTALLPVCEQASLLVIDLGRTSFLDSSVLGVIMGAHKRMAARGCPVVAVNATRAVRRVLEITRVDAVLCGSLEDEVDRDLREELEALLADRG